MLLNGSQYFVFALVLLGVLLPLAWYSLRHTKFDTLSSKLALGARSLGILILSLALLDPQKISERPIKGANIMAILADNSEGMRVKDEGEILDRGEHMRQYLTGRNTTWLAQINEEYQVRNYSFDRSARRVTNFQSLDFSGDRSQISRSLKELGHRMANLPLAGIALFTDGNATDASQLPNDLAHLPPIYPIVIGSDEAIPDLALDHVRLTESAFDDTPLSLQAEVTLQGQTESEVEVTLKRLDVPSVQGRDSLVNRPIETKRIALNRDKSSSIVDFDWIPSGAGIQFFELDAKQIVTKDKPLPEEATEKNNRRILMSDRGKNQHRILYVTGRPNWEYKFLNRSLAVDPQLNLVALIRIANREPKFEFKGRRGESSNPLYRGFDREDETERYDQTVLIRMNTENQEELRGGFPKDAETLFGYDAIILDDIEADFFSYSQQALLREFVKQRGGGLLFLGGANSLDDGGYSNTPIEQILPVYLNRTVSLPEPNQEFTWRLTREGWVEPWMRIHSTETDERDRLERMPNLKVANAIPFVKPGSRTLATVETLQGDAFPALVTRNYGSGRIACMMVGDLWRWSMQGVGEYDELAKFWRQISRWLVTDTLTRVVLETEKTKGDGIRLLVSAVNAEYQPLEQGRATLSLRQLSSSDKSSLSIELPMNPVSNEQGRFEVTVPIKDAGAYLASVEVTDENGVHLGMAETGWVSEPAINEFSSLSPNRVYLESIAAQTGGKVLELAQLDQLINELSKRPSPVMESWSDPIWHRNWVLALALACFLAEWSIRRRKGLA